MQNMPRRRKKTKISRLARSNQSGLSDPVNHPAHYIGHPSGIECIEVTRHMNFNLGNAIKYIWRAGEKGNEAQDLKKAVWYLLDEIEKISK
jgi:hypothetical protein